MAASIQGVSSIGGMAQLQAAKPLTAEQKKTVQDILSNYDAKNIGATGAKSMVKSLKEAGVRGSAMRDALQSAGFDLQQVMSMAHSGGRRHGGSSGQSNSTRSATLQSLQSIMGQFDLNNMSSADQKDVYTQLTQSGLLKTGASGVYNMTA